jgi:hypothetical protein
MRRRFCMPAVGALLTWGCAGQLVPATSFQANPQLLSLAPLVVFQRSSGPLSYQTAVGRDGQRYTPAQRVRGEACQRGIQVPILAIVAAAAGYEAYGGANSLSGGWGEGGFQAALEHVRAQMPSQAILYDVQADVHHRSYLSVYRIQCVSIDAGVLVPEVAPQATH